MTGMPFLVVERPVKVAVALSAVPSVIVLPVEAAAP